MSIIRGMIHRDRELAPKKITFGNPKWQQLECGCCWVDRHTGEYVDIEIKSLADLIDQTLPSCRNKSKDQEKK